MVDKKNYFNKGYQGRLHGRGSVGLGFKGVKFGCQGERGYNESRLGGRNTDLGLGRPGLALP